MGGYYEAYALGPKDEVSQFWDQEPKGVINPNAISPGVGDEYIPTDDVFLMAAEPSKMWHQNYLYVVDNIINIIK